MEFIGLNHKYDDCMIVAMHNASLAVGRNSTYEKVYNLFSKKGWYREGKGFECKFLDQAFATLKLDVSLVEKTAKEIFHAVFEQEKVYLFIRPNESECIPSHAMVAVRSDKGVKIHNPYIDGSGWRTLQKSIQEGHVYHIIEVTAK